jgi:four helix bundle protein
MAVTRFEDLIAWQRARELTTLIYTLTRSRSFSRDFGLVSQVQRASVSIMSNIAEGFERGRRPEFHQFLSIAKASCAEVRSLLYVARDIGYITEDQFAQSITLAEEVARIVGGLRASMRRGGRTED